MIEPSQLYGARWSVKISWVQAPFAGIQNQLKNNVRRKQSYWQIIWNWKPPKCNPWTSKINCEWPFFVVLNRWSIIKSEHPQQVNAEDRKRGEITLSRFTTRAYGLKQCPSGSAVQSDRHPQSWKPYHESTPLLAFGSTLSLSLLWWSLSTTLQHFKLIQPPGNMVG